MLPSGPSTPIGGSQSVSPMLLRSNSAILGSQGGGSIPPQAAFPTLVSPMAQYDMNLVGNCPSVSSLLNQSFGKGGSNTSLSGFGGLQWGNVDTVVESNPISMVANDLGFRSSFAPSNMANSGSPNLVQSQQIPNESMQQFPVSNSQPPQQQLRYQSFRGGLGAIGPVKLEPLVMNEQVGPQQKLQSLQSLGPVKVEPQQNLLVGGMGPVKLENQNSDQEMLLQQQQLIHLSRQSSQAAVAQMNYLQQQRILQLQQQQQLSRPLPQQQPQSHQQFQLHNLPVKSGVRIAYEPGTCAQRLTQYMYQQQHRPSDNNIEFWRKFVADFFTPSARKRWCVSLYGISRQTNGVFPQDLWQCEICNRKPTRGFEATVEILPRLFKIKYDGGTLEELLYVDMPCEYQNASGHVVLDYAKAIQVSVFEHLRVVRSGQLRIVFSPDLKICSWEFCAWCHEELIPRKLIIPQVSQLGAAAQRYQASAQNASSNSSTSYLESDCNIFVASACQLAKVLEVPLVNDLGYTKRYVRCLQISEVVSCMKDLIDHSRETGKGPIDSLAQFSRRTRPLSRLHDSVQQPEEQQQNAGQPMNNGHQSIQTSVTHSCTSSGIASANNSLGTMSTANSSTTIAALLHQNSMNSRVENQINNPGSPYTGTSFQIPSAGSSTTLPPAHLNPSSPLSSPTPSSSNNPPQTSHTVLTASAAANHISSLSSPAHISMQQSSQCNDFDANESQSSVEKIIREIMISSHFSGAGSMVSSNYEGDNMDINRLTQMGKNVLAGGNGLLCDGTINNHSSTMTGGFGNSAGGNALSGTLIRRVGTPMLHQDASMNPQQRELANQLLNGLGPVNGFFNQQFDWKSAGRS